MYHPHSIWIVYQFRMLFFFLSFFFFLKKWSFCHISMIDYYTMSNPSSLPGGEEVVGKGVGLKVLSL